MLAARFIMSLEVRNTTNVLIPTAGVIATADENCGATQRSCTL